MLNEAKRARLLKKFDKEFIWKDKDSAVEFYLGRTEFSDFTLTMYDTNNGTFREFLIDFHTLRSIFFFGQYGKVVGFEELIDRDNLIPLVKEYEEKHEFTILKAPKGSLFGAATLGKVGKYKIDKEDTEESEKEVLQLKRVAYVPFQDNMVLGIDTCAIPRAMVDPLIDKVEKHFEKADIELRVELEIEEE